MRSTPPISQACDYLGADSRLRTPRGPTRGTVMLEQLLSSDDHIIEPPYLWTDRVPTSEHDRVPHVQRIDGVDRWIVGGRPTASFAGGMNTGQRFEDPTQLRT